MPHQHLQHIIYLLPVLFILWIYVLFCTKKWWHKLILLLITIPVIIFSVAIGVFKEYEKSFKEANVQKIEQLHELGAYQQVGTALEAQQEFIEKRGKLGSDSFLNSKLRAIEKELDEELKSLQEGLNKIPGGGQLQSYE